MHERHRRYSWWPKAGRDSRRLRIPLGEQQGVLDVPPFALFMAPEARPQDIEADKAIVCKHRGPVLGPLLVDVVGPTLARDRS